MRTSASPLSWRKFFSLLDEAGLTAREEVAEVWQRRLETMDDSHSLAPIKHFYLGDLSRPSLPVEHAKTVTTLRACGLEVGADYPRWVPTYAGYLKREGFFA